MSSLTKAGKSNVDVAQGEGTSAAPPMADMFDEPQEMPVNEQLRAAIGACQQELAEAYAAFDAAALRHQRTHKRITITAAVFGTLAIVAAILQLSGRFEGLRLPGIEATLVVVTLAAVILGVFTSLQRKWLLERHKAERLRLLKFRALTDPLLWDGRNANLKEWTNRLRLEKEEIASLTHEALHHWVTEDSIPEVPTTPNLELAPSDLQSLIEYYRRKRLQAQMDYFARQARRNFRLDRWTRIIPPLFFFGSVTFALLHFGHDIFSAEEEGARHEASWASIILMLLAAMLPVLGAGLRTVRSALEFARNNIRFRAKLVALQPLAARLQEETDVEATFRDLWCCEQIFESEHREWLRLMIEAEWFG